MRNFIYVFFSLTVYQVVGQNDDCECIPFYLCNNGTINTNGFGIIDVRMGPVVDISVRSNNCSSYLDTCCAKENIDKDFKLEKSFQTLESCGTRHFDGVGYRITGDLDNEAQLGEFPWMVAILFKENSKAPRVYKCGGSLIHPRVVLTAAHCVHTKGDYKVRVGEWDSQTTREILKHQDMEVEKIIINPAYNENSLYHNIALLYLKDNVNRASHANIICLPHKNFVAEASDCIVTGWGKNKFGKDGVYQTILKKIELPIISKRRCQQAFRSTRLRQTFELHESFMCAGGDEGKDACTGDGGGPLVCLIPGTENKYQQVGIVSWGIGCGKKGIPGVYTDVARYRSWIDNYFQIENLNKTIYQYTP